jgi:hypothetical protein
MHKYIRWTLVCLLGLCTFALGLFRQKYIINLVDFSSPFLINRKVFLIDDYPLTFETLLNNLLVDPRWTSSFIYLCYPVVSTLIAIYLIFNQKRYVYITLLFYASGLIVLITMILFSVLANNYAQGYGLAQQVKKIYQEPYISLLLLGGFYWDKKNTRTKNN